MASRSHICSISASRWLDTSTVRPLVRQPAQQLADLTDAGRVEAVGRLVEHQQRRVPEQGCGEAEPLPHAERVLLHEVAGPLREADLPEDLVHSATLDPAHAGEQAQVLAARHRGEQRRGLDDRTDPSDDLRERSRDLGAEQAQPSGGRSDEAEQACGWWWSCRSRWARGSRRLRRAGG